MAAMSTLSRQLETTTQAARRLDISPRTLLRWLETGALPGVRTVGGHWRVDPTVVNDFIQRSQGVAGAKPRGNSPQILLVEDDVHHADALSRLLRLTLPSATIHRADDGVSAGLMLGVLVPDVAFVDIELPELDGIALIRLAGQQPKLRNVAFVVVSGRLTAERIAALEALGVQHILAKPVAPQQIQRVLAEFFPTGLAKTTMAMNASGAHHA